MTEIIQKRGFYEITTEAGAKARLDRVTTALDWVLKDADGAMAYYGGKLFAKWLGDDDVEWVEHYEAWKQSEYDPNRVLRSRADEGQSAHTLFGNLLEGKVQLRKAAADPDGPWWVYPESDEDLPFPAVGYDRGVLDAYMDIYAYDEHGTQRLQADMPLSEVRLYWTEHPIDDCPKHDSKGRCTHGFSGTCDVYFPHWGLDDLKTHVPGYRFSEWCQMAMYSLAAQQLYGADIARQRIVIAHDAPNEDENSPWFGKYYEVQDDRFLQPEAALHLWELFKLRKVWGPRR